MIKRIIQGVKKHGVKGTFKQVLGLNNYQKEIDTLFYLINEATDITKIGPTKNEDLRIMQLCNAALLSIFDKLCTKYCLRYWLDSGTLLGAVRHGGFIPWDDDLDVAMPREDYDKVISLMKEEMERYGIVVRWGGYYDDYGYMARLAFGYRTLETGVWMDIFPVDSCDTELSVEEAEPIIQKNIAVYQKYYRAHEKNDSIQQLTNKKMQIFHNISTGKNKIWYCMPEFVTPKHVVIGNDMIFPLQRMDFEGYSLNIPANANEYLSKKYGNNYMEYPHTGVLHHGDPDGGLVQERAKKHNVDMNEVLEYLVSVAAKI